MGGVEGLNIAFKSSHFDKGIRISMPLLVNHLVEAGGFRALVPQLIVKELCLPIINRHRIRLGVLTMSDILLECTSKCESVGHVVVASVKNC